MGTTSDARLDEMTAALTSGHLRIEFSIAFGLRGGSYPSAQLYRKNESGRWVKAGPFVVPPEGGTRADLLDMFASMARES